MRENITLLLLIIIIIGASISIGYMASNDIESMISKIQNDYGDSPEECVNLSLKGTAYCLLAYVETIYKYTETKDSIGLTLEELIEKGGDCKNWAELYYGYAEELGFHVKRPSLTMREGVYRHTFTIISDETGYCILDQLNIKCVKVKLPDTEEDE